MKLQLLWLSAALAALSPLSAQIAPKGQWWEAEPLRIIDLTTSFFQPDGYDPARLAARKATLGYNAEHLEIMRMPGGLDDRGFYFRSKVSGRENADYLGRYAPEAHKHGLRTFIYFNVHWYTMKFAEQHPDWRMTRENGKPLDAVYDTGADFCVNTPWREWVFQLLRDLAAYPIDGIFYDGPVYRADTCYCRHCRDKYRRIYNREMPSKSKRSGKDFAQLMEFQANSLKDFLHDSRVILKDIRPDLALYMNGGVRGANWATGRFNRTLIAEQDLLGSEGGFISGDLTRVPLWKPGLTARLLETQAGGKPTIIFSAAGHKPWTFSLLPAPELRLLYADTIANGAGVWMGITPMEFEEPEMQALTEMNRFVERNKAYYTKTKSAARVAVVWSEVTASFYAGAAAQMIDIDRTASRSAIGNLDGEFAGITESLLRAQVPFDVIDDVTLDKEPIDRYRAIFLPNVACMSDRVAARLRKYVEDGGNLFADFETSMYDETGIRRGDFALASVFGVSAASRIIGPLRWDFLQPVTATSLAVGITRKMIPSTAYYVQTRPGTAEVAWKYTEPLAGRYDGVPKVSNDPGLVTRKSGKGTVAYMPGDVGNSINTFHTPELMQLVANAGRQLGASAVRLENAPESVELVVRAQDKRLLVHLVNFTGEMTRPIRRIVPVPNVRITVQGQYSTAKSLWTGKALPMRNGSVTLPLLHEYDVIVFE
ncbi:MAG: beta-galactosidase trimerization domain-containing protein [Acidobacteria bacterium]|nr:beta-galactosidase trimerization domain-containing protein [Acidobacteriota bacterium]